MASVEQQRQVLVETAAENGPEESTNAVDLKNNELFPALPTASRRPPAAQAPVVPMYRKMSDRITERFEIPIHAQVHPLAMILRDQARQREQLGARSASEVVKSVQTKTNTEIEFSTATKTGTLTFLVSGSPSKVKVAVRQLQQALCAQVTQIVSVPASVRPFIVGTGGKNLKDLTNRTMTRISLPKRDEDADQDDVEQDITISGDVVGVEMARKEIEALVAQKTLKKTVRLNVERSYHPFIAGPNNAQIQDIQAKTGARITLAPLVPSSAQNGNSDIRNEVVISGDRDNVDEAQRLIEELYEMYKRTTRTLVLPINKKQHRFIIGPKGSCLSEIMEKTGCHVDLPLQSDPSDIVTVRGPEASLSVALGLVLEKASSISIATVDVVPLINQSQEPALFFKYLFTKERASLKAIEAETNSTIIQSGESLEIQAKTKNDVEECSNKLTSLIRELGKLFITSIEIPCELHKYVIGKSGSNLAKLKTKTEFNGRFVDALFPFEDEESDDVIIIVKRKSGAVDASSDKEAKQFVKQVQSELVSAASQMADYTTKTIEVDPKYHGRLIGSGGAVLKELLGELEKNVSVRFPSSKSLSKDREPLADNEILIRGSSKDVTTVIDRINRAVAYHRHFEVMNSYTDTVSIPKGVGHQLTQPWLVKTLREVIEKSDREQAKFSEKEIATLHQNIRFEVSKNQEEVVLIGIKNLVDLAKPIIAERALILKDTVTREFPLVDKLSGECKLMMEKDDSILDNVLKRTIGKAGRNLKKIGDNHHVTLRIYAERKDEANSRDVVTIKGTASDVAAAQKELLEFVENEILRSYTRSLTIGKEHIARLMGRGGSRIQQLKGDRQVRVDFFDIPEDESNVSVVFQGLKDEVESLIVLFEESVDEIVNTVEDFVLVPVYLHKNIIGSGGNALKATIDQFLPEKVRINLSKTSGDLVTVTAHRRIIEEVKAALLAQVDAALGGRREDPIIEDTLLIPRSDLSFVQGRNGELLRKTEAKFKVSIFVGDNQGDMVVLHVVSRISQEGIDGAKIELTSRTRASEIVSLPSGLLPPMEGLDAEIETAFLKDTIKKIRTGNGVSLDLRDDQVVVRGDKKGVALAVSVLTKTFEGLKESSYDFMAVDSSMKPHIIGRAGAVISKIRTESGANLELYRSNGNDVVLFSGKPEEVQSAKELVEAIVKQQEERRARDEKRAEEEAKRSAEIEEMRKSEELAAKENGMARIDMPSDSSRHVPGWSGPRKVEAISSVIQNQQPVVAQKPSAAKQKEQWQSVKPRKKKAEPVTEKKELSNIFKEVPGAPFKITPVPPKVEEVKPSVFEEKEDVSRDEVETNKEAAAKKKKKMVKKQSVSAEVSGELAAPVPVALPEKSKETIVLSTSPQQNMDNTLRLPPSPVKQAPEPEEWVTVNSVKKFKQQKSAAAKTVDITSDYVAIAAVALGIDQSDESSKKKKRSKRKKNASSEKENVVEA